VNIIIMADIWQRNPTRPTRPFDHHPHPPHQEGPFRKKRNSWDPEYENRIDYLERALEDAEKKIRMDGNLVRKVSELERKNRKLERSLGDAEIWIKKLRKKSPPGNCNECNHHELNIDKMEKNNRIMKDALENSERRIKDLEDQINDSAEKMMDAYNNVGCVESAGEKNPKLEENLKKAEERVKQLEEEKDEVRRSGLDPESGLILRRTLEDTEKKVEYFQNGLSKSEKKLKEVSREKDALEQSLKSATSSVKNLTEELEKKDARAKQLENELKSKLKTIADKEVDSLALMKVKSALNDGNVTEKVDFISQEIISLSNILKQIKDISK